MRKSADYGKLCECFLVVKYNPATADNVRLHQNPDHLVWYLDG